MEKHTAHYPLATLQALIQQLGATAFTYAAAQGGYAMGLDKPEMLAVIAGLRPKNLYKSMTTYDDHAIWQDVYHAKVVVQGKTKMAYIKLTLRNGKPIVQFKEK